MAKPVVAIVGRPNVGKSTLFNRLIGRRVAIVEDTPGVTRDRIYAEASWRGRDFVLTDTGGILWGDQDPIRERILDQAQVAMEEADVIIMVADVRDGLTGADHDIAEFLRRAKRPVLVAANKADDENWSHAAAEFHAMGFDEMFAISAHHGHGIADLLDAVAARLPDATDEPQYDDSTVRLAVVGRPNVGKSSLINAILGEERVIVSDVAGTTRDAIDTPFTWRDRNLVFVDTAGIRRSGKVQGSIEYYSVLRAMRAMERADVALLVVDGVSGLLDGDKRVGGYAKDANCACVVVVNKGDIAPDRAPRARRALEHEIRLQMPFLDYAPIAFISALRGTGLDAVIDASMVSYDNYNRRIQTGELNRLLHEWTDARPYSRKGRELKVYYGTMSRVRPPTITLFVNDPQLFHFSYRRYLLNRFRAQFGFAGTPLILNVRKAEGERGKPRKNRTNAE
ncbi:MAG: ribosome biogenesis GTPase Der [Armatimonadetes bacterium]|nr:ribosome biogenesis GTPase Der [Armatimonadota bacterium]